MTNRQTNISAQTRNNWLIDAALFFSGLIATLSGVYFLFLPNGGYQGGRNPGHNVTILFDRRTWDDLHTWSGVAMIIAAILHLALHWPWVLKMTQRVWNEISGKGSCLNPRGRLNLILNLIVALSFLLASISGTYFLFFPGKWGTPDTQIIFERTSWDAMHTWAGVILIAAAMLHLAIHWRWIVNVTRKMFGHHGNEAMRLAPEQSD